MRQSERAQLAIAIDFGELSTGLSGIMGIGRGIAEERVLAETSRRMVNMSTNEFGEVADSMGPGSLAHVYEYGREGDRNGRLWSIEWMRRGGDMVGNVRFQTAKKPTRPGSGIDSRLAEHANAAGKTLASHYFPKKAEHLENTKRLVSVAGQQKHTRRSGGVANPQALVYIDDAGNVRFSKRYARDNEFYGKFQEAFRDYWVTKFEATSGKGIQRAFRSAVMRGERAVAAEVAKATAVSRPRMPKVGSGVFITNKGVPSRGIRLSETIAKRISGQVADRLRKEMVRGWQG